jgi:hypothetical protein
VEVEEVVVVFLGMVLVASDLRPKYRMEEGRVVVEVILDPVPEQEEQEGL